MPGAHRHFYIVGQGFRYRGQQAAEVLTFADADQAGFAIVLVAAVQCFGLTKKLNKNQKRSK